MLTQFPLYSIFHMHVVERCKQQQKQVSPRPGVALEGRLDMQRGDTILLSSSVVNGCSE